MVVAVPRQIPERIHHQMDATFVLLIQQLQLPLHGLLHAMGRCRHLGLTLLVDPRVPDLLVPQPPFGVPEYVELLPDLPFGFLARARELVALQPDLGQFLCPGTLPVLRLQGPSGHGLLLVHHPQETLLVRTPVGIPFLSGSQHRGIQVGNLAMQTLRLRPVLSEDVVP